VQLANWLALNHPDADKRAIAKATGKKIAELQAAGLKVTVHYPKIGDMAPSGLDGAHGLVQPRFRKEGTTFDVWFNPAKAGRRSGMRVSTLLHELVHVATHASVQLGNRTKAADSANKRAIIRLIEVKAALNEHFKERKAFISRTSGMFTDVERHLFEGSNGSLNSLDELLAEANSDRAFQDYLRSIPYKKTTLWGELVSAVREFLGVAAGSESALDEVMSITEELYAAPISELKAAAEAMGADFLPGSDLFKLVDDGPRPLTFDEMPFNADTGPQKLGKRVVKAATEGISGIRGLFEPAKEGKLASAAKGLGYGLMDMRSMVRMLEAANSTAKDSVKGWMRHMNKKSQLAKQVQETAARWVREAGQLTKKHQFYLEKVMAEATTYKIHPDAEWEVVQPPGADKDKSKRIPDPNAHLRDEDPKVYAENKKRYDALRHTWNELVGSEPRVEKIYKGMRDEIQDLHRRSFELRKKFVEDNKMLSEANKKKIIALYHDLYNRNQSGPYFPKKRFGDWYVTVKLPEQRIGTDGKVNGDFFATEESAKEEQKRQKALHPDAKPYVKKTEDGYAVMLNVRAVAFYESQAEARSPEARAELIAEVKERYADVEGGMDAAQLEMGEEKIISEPNMKRADFGDTKAMGAAFGEELAKLMTDPSFPPELAEELRYLQYQSMPENSYTKQLLPRKDIIGASKNMLQAYVVGMQGAANNYARLKHGKDIDQNWEEAWAAARKAGDASAERVLTELGKNQALVAKRERESVGENALSTISQINSLYSLGFSVPYALSNMTQPWMVTVPVLGAFANGRTGKVVGNVKAAKYMKAAYEDAFGFFTKRAVQETVTEWRGLVNKGGGDFTQSDFQKQMIERFAKNDPQFAEVMQHLYDSGLLDYTFISAMSDAAKSSGQGLAKVQRLSMAFPAQIEAMNRLVTAKAAVNLARDEFLVSEPDSVNELSLFAEDIVAQTQGDYSRSNRARVFNTAVGGIAFQFKQYLQMMYMLFGHNLVQVMRKDATPAQRKQSLRTIRNLMMSHAAIAGASGLGPVSMAAKVILGMAAMALGDEDDEWKSGEQLQSEVLTGLFGKEMAEVADQGLPRLIGADLGDRQSFPDLFDTRFLGVQQGAKPGEWMDAFLAQSAGAAYANTKRVGNGLRALAQGRGWDASQALPSGLRPVVQSIRMAQQGMVDGDGDVVIPASELGWKDMAIKSIGAQPAAIARRYEEQREIKGTHARIVAKRRQVMQDARNGEISWDDVREFNKTVRPGFRISPAQLQQAKASKGKREAGVEPKGEAEVRRMLGR